VKGVSPTDDAMLHRDGDLVVSRALIAREGQQ